MHRGRQSHRTFPIIRHPHLIRFVRPQPQPRVFAPCLLLIRYNTVLYPEATAILPRGGVGQQLWQNVKRVPLNGLPLASLRLVSLCLFVLKPVVSGSVSDRDTRYPNSCFPSLVVPIPRAEPPLA